MPGVCYLEQTNASTRFFWRTQDQKCNRERDLDGSEEDILKEPCFKIRIKVEDWCTAGSVTY